MEDLSTMADEFVYSLDNEWFDDFDSVMDFVNSEYEPGSRVTLYKGRPVPVTHEDVVKRCFFKGHLLEFLQEAAYDEYGEVAENYLTDLGEGDEESIIDEIVIFLNENVKEPNFYTVKDVEEIEVLAEG